MKWLDTVLSGISTFVAKTVPATARKPIIFGIFGALGCLLGAGIGEAFLALTTPPAPADPPVTPKSICLVLDCSGSMAGPKLDETKQAAASFLRQHDLQNDDVAVVRFESTAQIICPLTRDRDQLISGVRELASGGSTAMNLAFQQAQNVLRSSSKENCILLFTDGAPDDARSAINEAAKLRAQGAKIVAIATGDANTELLTMVTGHPNLVLWVASGQFDEAFTKAQKLLASSLIGGAVHGSSLGNLARTGGWTSLLALGLCLSLIVGQNHYLRRALLDRQEGIRGTLGSIIAGLIAGCTGQLLYVSSAGTCFWGGVGWGICGALLALILGLWSDPTSGRKGVAIGVGGFLAAASFFMIALIIGPFPSRGTRGLLWLAAWAGVGALLGSIINARSTAKLDPKLAAKRGVSVGAAIGIAMIAISVLIRGYSDMISQHVARFAGWIILGVLLGWGMSLFVPNLGGRKAAMGGAAGGLLGAAGFLGLGALSGDVLGRLLGALVLGFSIGLMIALLEIVFRKAWLEIEYGPGNARQVNLGKEPVFIGSGPNCTVYASNTPEIALCYRLDGNRVLCDDVLQNSSTDIKPGDSRQIGLIKVTLCADVDTP